VDGAVEDSVNGRFEMVATLLSLVLLRLERDPNCKQEGVHLTELFVDDMDPQLREFGVGDMIVGKHIGKLMSALGGRLGVLRDALNSGGGLAEFIGRNLYRGEARLLGQTQFLESALVSIVQRLASADTAQLIAGKADW
jgi:cytochrome b pre-mRNA-processing protein 3